MPSLLTGLVVGLAVAMPPGAVASLIIRTGLERGFRAALAAGWGTATVDGIYCTIAVLFGALIVPLLGSWTGPLQAVTGVVLIGLGVLGIVRARAGTAAARPPNFGDLAKIYVRFIVITMVNPATLAYFAAVSFGLAGTVLTDGPAFVLGVFAASIAWHLLLALLSGSLHGKLGPRARTVLAVVANGVVIAIGLRILTQAVAG